MSDYIKREDAIKAVIADAKLKNLLTGNCENEKAIEGMVYEVLCPRDIPSADVVEVVRCKDCKYRIKEWYRDKRYKDGGYWIVGCGNDEIAERVYGLAQDNDYCGYGERREA